MRLTFFGSSIVSAYWNGAATYYRGLLRALAAHGHDIVFCEPDAFDRQRNRDLEHDPDYVTVCVYETEAERDALVERALSDSDWVVKCSGVGVWDDELEAAIAGGGPARTAFWDVDAPATLASLERPDRGHARALIPRFDGIFTYGGGPPVVAAYEALGARACVPVYNGLDPEAHRPHEVEPDHSGGNGASSRGAAPGGGTAFADPEWDVLFMGNRLPDRDARVEEFFLRPAEALPGRRFALGGSGWGDRSLPSNVTLLGHVPTCRHNEVNAAARLVLNVHREPMVRNGWSPATRMFEAAGAAACQVTDAWEGIETFFEPDREILVARDGSDVVRLVERVTGAEARGIGLAARARALRDHTYARRARGLHQRLENGWLEENGGREGVARSSTPKESHP